MKKLLGLISFILVAVLFLGCSNNNTAQVRLAGQKLDASLNNLIREIKT